MAVFSGPRICPSCRKKGRLMPVNKKAGNPFFRAYHCQSCHWGGLMFRMIKNQSRSGFYLTLLLMVALLGLIGAVMSKLLGMLPEF